MKRSIEFVVCMVVTTFIMVGGMVNSAFAEKASEVDAVKAANAAFYAALSARDVGAWMKVWSTKSEVRHIDRPTQQGSRRRLGSHTEEHPGDRGGLPGAQGHARAGSNQDRRSGRVGQRHRK